MNAKPRNNNAKRICRKGFIFALTLVCVLHSYTPLTLAADGKEQLNAEEILKTKAGKLFVTRQYSESLEEFRRLAEEYPRDIAVRRYMGACLDHLRRDEEALTVFTEILQTNPHDLPSRQYRGKIYVRAGKLKEAEEEFAYILEHDKQNILTSYAQAQIESIRRLQESEKSIVRTPSHQITPQEFLKTQAAKLVMAADYETAYEEILKLEEQYPQDVLILRYKGLILDRLGRPKEAISIFQSELERFPDNIPLHYFLAHSLVQDQNFDQAEKEFGYVAEHDETGSYQVRAKKEQEEVREIIAMLKRSRQKKWLLLGSAGAEWVSNPTLLSRVPEFTTEKQQGAWTFTNSAYGNYELFKKMGWTARVFYNYFDAFYSHGFSELNVISNSAGPNLTHITLLNGRPLITRLGSTVSHTMLHNKYYSTAFAQSAGFIYSFYDWQRIDLSDRWSYSTYDNDGSSSDHTSRNGFTNTAAVAHYLYMNKAKSLYQYMGFNYENAKTQGANYHKNQFSYHSGLHFPLPFRSDADLAFKYKDADYPKYLFPEPSFGRRDHQYQFTVNLSKSITEHWSVEGKYDYTNNNSRDDNYTYTNHSLGFTLSFQY